VTGKTCIKCGEFKLFSEFPEGRRKTKKGVITYLRGECRECRRVFKTEWARNNKDKGKANYLKHREKLLVNRRRTYHQNRDAHLVEMREYYANNHEKELARSKKQRDGLSDAYIRSLLLQDSAASFDVPQALIEAKRLQLTIWRMTHEKR
jgi:hypothetical protein